MNKVVKYEMTEEEFSCVKEQLNLMQNAIDKMRRNLNEIPDSQKTKCEAMCSNELDYVNGNLYKVRLRF